MRREWTNRIRFVLDELLPPVIRDSYWFMYPFFFIIYKGRGIRRKMLFKSLVYSMSEREQHDFYNEIDALSGKRQTDLAESNIRYILDNLLPGKSTIVDIGCGKGYLLGRIREARPEAELFGLDMENRLLVPGVRFGEGSIASLPFADKQFDVVICTHTIEHVVGLQQAMDELMRVAARQLIIVTPCQRYFYYTLDGHINFFYRREELLRYLPWKNYLLQKLDSDWVYIGSRKESQVGF